MKMEFKSVLALLACFALVHMASAGCPDSKGFFDCSGDKDPCRTVKCASGTTCHVDTCGGCHATCEKEGMMHIQSVPTEEVQSPQAPSNPRDISAEKCPDGSSFVNCLADPCDPQFNPCKASQICHTTYCGGCKAICVDTKPKYPSENVADNIIQSSELQCPLGQNPVQCIAQPCKVSNPCDPATEICQDNYCGECKAVCVKKSQDTLPEPVALPTPNVVKPPAQTICNISACAATTCPDNSMCIAIGNTTSCTAKCVKKCGDGYGMDLRTEKCSTCKIGYVTNAEQNVCVACPKDTYFRLSRTGGRTCLPCSAGKSTKGKTGQLRCV